MEKPTNRLPNGICTGGFVRKAKPNQHHHCVLTTRGRCARMRLTLAEAGTTAKEVIRSTLNDEALPDEA